MDKIIKGALSRSRWIALISLISAVVIALSIFSFTKAISASEESEVGSTLAEIAVQGANALRRQLQGELRTLDALSHLIGRQETFRAEEVVDGLQPIQQENGYVRMGIILPDGTALTTDHLTLFLGDRAYFHAARDEGKSTVSDTLTSKTDDSIITVLCSPIQSTDETFLGALFATISMSDYQKGLEVTSLGGDGYSYVVKRNGNAVVTSSSPSGLQNLKNIFLSLSDADDRNEKSIRALQDGMVSGKSGHLEFYNHEKKYLYYTPLEINDWYLLAVVPSSAFHGGAERVAKWFYIFGALIIITVGLLVTYILLIQRRNRMRLESIAYTDELTGGRSYKKFLQDTRQILSSNPDQVYAIASLDIDKFKFINDIFGFHEGNSVILHLSDVFEKHMRGEEIFAHRSADHFVLLLCCPIKEQLQDRLDEIVADIRSFREQGVNQYELVLSVGVYIVEDLSLDIAGMVDRAELPRKQMKGNHTSAYAFFDDKIRDQLINDKNIEDHMAQSLRDRDFLVYFQPQYLAANKRLAGAEALVRWQFSGKGLLPPSEFVPVFENNGFITKLDKYIFEEVCRKMRQWIDEGYKILPVSVNLSRLHLYNPNFVQEYQTILQKYRVPAQLIQLELTESALFDNADILLDIIEQFHALGFSILMDDFGTGYSSLNMLKDIPVDILKLDRGFVEGSSNSEKGAKIIESIIRLARSLNMNVIAEGVETVEQFEFLRGIGCNEIQGYYFSRPVPVSDYEAILREAASLDEPADAFCWQP